MDYCTKPDISDFLHNLTFSGEADFSTGNMTKEVPSSSSQTFNAEPNTAFSSFILQFGTFWIANNLKIFRNGKTLGRKVIFLLIKLSLCQGAQETKNPRHAKPENDLCKAPIDSSLNEALSPTK
jgi:hypothetical protein